MGPVDERTPYKIDVKDKVITADAMHTQVDLANYIKKREADYVSCVIGLPNMLLYTI
jgi:predicted transposase YbfD/YdcC